jgi:hypothetical protein
MWETFTTDLVDTSKRNVLGLAHSGSNIIKHVRKMHLLDRRIPSSNEDNLPMFLATIPRGQLREFKCGSGVSSSALTIMLQIHTDLEELSVSGTMISTLLDSLWIVGSFSGLTRMDIFVNRISKASFQRLWSRCPRLAHIRLLRSVELFSSSTTLDEKYFASGQDLSLRDGESGADTQRHDTLKLSSLYGGNITLPQTFNTMFQRIDILALRELVLDDTELVPRLLEAMASEFGKGEPSLQKLRLNNTDTQTNEDFIYNLTILLLSFSGLRQLHIRSKDCNKIDPDGIINHGETFTDLLIVNGGIHRKDSAKSTGAEDLQNIAIACPNLEQICLNLYEIHPDHPDHPGGDFLGPDPAVQESEATDFEDALAAIASMRNLHTLRLTNPHNYRRVYFRPGEFMRFHRRSLESGEQ